MSIFVFVSLQGRGNPAERTLLEMARPLVYSQVYPYVSSSVF